MTYEIPADSPRAAVALAFGRELTKALAARDISRKELGRALGVGHTTLWHYANGRTLPRIEAASAIAATLNWPKLRDLVVKARTRTCRRSGCRNTFINDIGSEARKYCTPACATTAAVLRVAETHARRAGQTDSHQARRAQLQRLRSGLHIADERAGVLQAAINAMCSECEPEGLCRTADCPLRQFSPLPVGRDIPAGIKTESVRRREIWTDGRRDIQRESNAVRWARPGERERQAEQSRSGWAGMTPEQRAERIAKAKASYPASRRSETSRLMHAARKASA